MTWSLVLLFRPIGLLILATLFFAPAVYAVRRWMPDGYLKRLLLFRIHDGRYFTVGESLTSLRESR